MIVYVKKVELLGKIKRYKKLTCRCPYKLRSYRLANNKIAREEKNNVYYIILYYTVGNALMSFCRKNLTCGRSRISYCQTHDCTVQFWATVWNVPVYWRSNWSRKSIPNGWCCVAEGTVGELQFVEQEHRDECRWVVHQWRSITAVQGRVHRCSSWTRVRGPVSMAAWRAGLTHGRLQTDENDSIKPTKHVPSAHRSIPEHPATTANHKRAITHNAEQRQNSKQTRL